MGIRVLIEREYFNGGMLGRSNVSKGFVGFMDFFYCLRLYYKYIVFMFVFS